jgi:DNA repair protein RecN (Recombination protein N)
MLAEITIRDFAIIHDLTIEFAPGFNVLTGETGAGKSIILDAMSLLLGGRADSDVVRSGAEAAYIEGVFSLDARARRRIEPILEQEGLEGESPDLLTLAREVRREGRSVARVNGRSVTLGLLSQIGEGLVDIHGQSEHLSLLRPASHLDLLDRYGGLEEQRTAFAQIVAQIKEVRRELGDLLDNEEALARRAELLAYQVEEINAARLSPGEESELRDEAKRLANAEQLAALTEEAYRALYESEGEGQSSAIDLLSQAALALERLAKIDPAIGPQAEGAEALSIQAQELAHALRAYREGIEFSPERLREVEERLDLIARLRRKYAADDIAGILAYAEQAAAELEGIEHSEERIEELRAEEGRLLGQAGQVGAALSHARVSAADHLAQAVEGELADLRMDARFEVAIEQMDDPRGVPVGNWRAAFDESGIDRVEFLIAPNVGEPLKPMARIASGGETSRLMLALKAVLTRADHTPSLIFDEIDSGIGGRIGAVVGGKLWGLARDHQVLVVTHLPQLAGFADQHLKVYKIVEGERTLALVASLDEAGRVAELAEMLGAETESAAQSAREILDYVRGVKQAS